MSKVGRDSTSSKWKEADYFPDDKDQKALVRWFEFPNFKTALDFVNQVGELAEKANHHPDINLGWAYVKVWLTSHDAHGVTEKDRKLADAIDKVFSGL